MKICFIAPANNYHTKKWCNWFRNRGHEIHVISFIRDKIEGVHVHFINAKIDPEDSDSSKIKYLLHARKMKKLIDKINPDVINVHYATSYGTVAALSGIRPYFLSIWGSDIYDFPNRSSLHKIMLKFSLNRATYLFSTSHAMAVEASKYTKKKFEITPFGVDMDLFNPNKRTRSKNSKQLIIGTVKSLSELYGIQYILEAAAIISNDRPDINLFIRISGDGPAKNKLKRLTKKLGLDKRTLFLGKITQEEAAKEWANMDIAIIPSIMYESFGVSAIEAEASSIPLIISNVGGLKETTIPGKSSMVVATKNAEEIAKCIIELYENDKLREEMGRNGRKFVETNYELNNNFLYIESIFINKFKNDSLHEYKKTGDLGRGE